MAATYRLNQTKRRQINKLIDKFIVDVEALAAFDGAARKFQKIVKEELLKTYSQKEMKVLKKYNFADIGTFNIKYDSQHKGYNGELIKRVNYQRFEEFDVGFEVFVPYNGNYSPLAEISFVDNEFLKNALDEYNKAHEEFKKINGKMLASYHRIIESKNYWEHVIDMIPWLTPHFGKIFAETKCIAHEDDAKLVLEVENKRAAA